ncbi:uncharacterized protein LOC120444095 [Drosophila santomea]|uniref:uncharacterized protein LOC120444095 n=1 Tax=Drosophila santomea TaxID=129105 RepID=UPI00195488D1|nr:uncharacterized protein LOC120444095 [Drosophila santomea]
MKQQILVCLGYVLLLGASAEALAKENTIFSANKRLMDQTLQVMSHRRDPCENFVDYAKGNYGPSMNLYYHFDLHMNLKFLVLFEQLKYMTFETGSLEEKVLHFYKTCEMAKENELEDLNYLDIVQPSDSFSWPHQTPSGTEWPKEKFQWLETLARLSRFGMNAFIQMNLELDHQGGTSVYMILIGRHYFEVTSYYNAVKSAETRLIRQGFDKSRTEFFMRGMQNLHKDLLKLPALDKHERRRMTLQELESDHGVKLGKYLEIAFGRPFPPEFVVLVDYLDFLIKLNQIMTSFDQETVAIYMMNLFADHTTSSIYVKTYRDYDFLCVNIVQYLMKSASYLLYEEHVLGPKKVKEYETEVQRVFKAIREQFKLRLDTNRLNLTTSNISLLQNILSSLTVSVGNVRRKQDRGYLTDLYADLNPDDDFSTMHLKALKAHIQIGWQKLDSIELTEPSGTAIDVPFGNLEEPFFAIRGHDVFKVSLLGFKLAEQVLSALFPYPKLPFTGCHKYNELIETLDDLGNYVDRSPCISPRETEMWNYKEILVVILNLVQDAYFSAGSEFDQTQPSFTDKTLKELFYLHFAQNKLDKYFYQSQEVGKPPRNLLLNIPSFVEAFSCNVSRKV